MLLSLITFSCLLQTARAAEPAAAPDTRTLMAQAATRARQASSLVFDGTVRPNWIGKTGRFWYRREAPGRQWSFVYVDPSAPLRRPAFDQEKLAAALTKALGRQITANRLPIDELIYPTDTQSALRIRVADKLFDCDLRTYVLRPVAAPPAQESGGIPPSRLPPSRDGGPETELTFVNHTGSEVAIYWIDGSGARTQYGTLAPGESRSQHTFAGHSWLILRHSDNTPVAAFVAAETPAVAVIGAVQTSGGVAGNTDAPRPRRRRQAAAVSPDGKWRVIVRDSNVILHDETSGTDTTLTTDGSSADAYGGAPIWSPDSRHFVLMKTIPAETHKVYIVESSPADQLQPKLHDYDYLKPGDRIEHPRPHLFDVTAKRDIPISESLFPNPWSIEDFQWQPDSSAFTFLYNQRGHQIMRLISVDAASGIARTIIDEHEPTFIDYTNKVYLHRLEATHEAVWMSERSGWNQLYLYDTATGAVKNPITHGDWVVRGVERIDEARQIWFRAAGLTPGEDPYYVHLCRVNFDGSGFVDLTPGDGTHTFVFSPDRDYLLDTRSRVDLPPITILRRATDGQEVLPLETGDAKALLATGWHYPERFVAKARDNKTDIYGVVLRPTNFDPKRRYPVLENIYAGPQGAFVPKPFSASPGSQRLADLGFIVVQIDGMGTNWRSKAFHDVCWKNLADAGFPDRIRWIRAAAASICPQMDLTRVGIYGTSAGGQDALSGLLRFGDFYKAGVADCGCHDNRMDKIWWNEQWMGWPVGPEYAANSNVTAAAGLKGKLLLMVGEMDTNVDPASTMQVVNALIKADRDFEYLVMPGRGHGAAGTPYGQRRVADFFLRTLGGPLPAAPGKRP